MPPADDGDSAPSEGPAPAGTSAGGLWGVPCGRSGACDWKAGPFPNSFATRRDRGGLLESSGKAGFARAVGSGRSCFCHALANPSVGSGFPGSPSCSSSSSSSSLYSSSSISSDSLRPSNLRQLGLAIIGKQHQTDFKADRKQPRESPACQVSAMAPYRSAASEVRPGLYAANSRRPCSSQLASSSKGATAGPN